MEGFAFGWTPIHGHNKQNRGIWSNFDHIHQYTHFSYIPHIELQVTADNHMHLYNNKKIRNNKNKNKHEKDNRWPLKT